MIGRYELGRQLGSGGMGVVYEAVAHGPGELRRSVALKVLHAGADELRREATIGGLLRHPHLVDVYEVGEVDGTWYCAMELCRDGTVADHVPLSPRAVIEVGLQVCSALAYAHSELGLVHLDLKPQNLLLDGASVKVADLGISRARGFHDDGRVRGTPGYMAPEQLRGGVVDARTDVYALGVVLNELATGSRVAASDTFGFEDSDAPVDPADGPDWLAAVVAQCTDPDPNARYASMVELAEALRALPAHGPSLRDVLGVPAAPDVAATDDAGPSNRFVGRGVELATIAGHLERPTLLTLKGSGGIGKTRLARAAAAAWTERSRASLFCDLTSAREPADVLFGVASLLGVPVGRSEPAALAQQVGQALAARGPVLVVLDTFEHVLGGTAFVVGWRSAAPEARWLVTSREALRCEGEVVLELDPLGREDGVALLVARARERGAEIDGDPALAQLAERLDGLPLALELAAGRIGVLSAADVLERLGMSLLRSGRADASDREATLRGALDWSYEQLALDERAVLAQLSVFRGGFAVEAALAVAVAGQPVVDVLDALYQRSMLVTGDGRLRLLEPLREYAAEKLEAAAEAEVRHGAWFARFGASEAVASLDRHGGVGGGGEGEGELEKLVAACERALARHDAEVAAATLQAMWAVVDQRGPYRPCLALAEAVLSIGGDPVESHRIAGCAALRMGRNADARRHFEAVAPLDRGVASGNLGVHALHSGQYAEAAALFVEAIDAHRASGNRRNEGLVLGNLGILAGIRGAYDEAGRYLEAALGLHREVGDRALEGLALGNLGLLAQERGDVEAASACYLEALAVHREVGSRQFEALVLTNLGNLERERGRYVEARSFLEACARLARLVGSRRDEAVACANLGRTAHEDGGSDDAEPHFIAALAMLSEVSDRRFEALAWGNYGRMLGDRGRLTEAREVLERALSLQRELGNAADVAVVQGRLAVLAAREGAFDECDLRLAEAEPALAGAGRPRDRAELLAVRAEVERLRGDPAAAALARQAALALAPPAWIRTWLDRGGPPCSTR